MEEVPTPFGKDIELVTGRQGKAHITATQKARHIAGIVGRERYILNTGDKFAITVDNATQITIGTGDAIVYGRHVTIESPVTLSLKPGKQGVKRYDIVCLRVELAGKKSVDEAKILVLDGTESSDAPKDPPLETASLLSGATVADLPLWRIPIDGITVGKPTWLKCPQLTSVTGLIGSIKDGIKDDAAAIKKDVAALRSSIASEKAKVQSAVRDADGLEREYQRLSAVPTVVHSPTTTETIRVGMRYTRPILDYADSMRDTTVDDLGFDFIIEVKKWHTIKKESIFTPSKDAKIINYINLTFKQDPLLEGSDLENREIFPFKIKGSEEQTGIGDAGFRDRIDNALTRVRGLKFTVWLSHPMKDDAYSITGDWGYIDDATYKTRDSHGDDVVKHYKIYGYSGIDCTKYASFIEFGLDSSYVSGFLESRFRIAKYKPATLTIS